MCCPAHEVAMSVVMHCKIGKSTGLERCGLLVLLSLQVLYWRCIFLVARSAKFAHGLACHKLLEFAGDFLKFETSVCILLSTGSYSSQGLGCLTSFFPLMHASSLSESNISLYSVWFYGARVQNGYGKASCGDKGNLLLGPDKRTKSKRARHLQPWSWYWTTMPAH